ncbi:hypothetical protein BLJ79_14540 [Arthrobacter sp. UCD-GKA]|nr:hypothetical protein BLJ79_14540 [Arthrobacter sp. UCD-GKA]
MPATSSRIQELLDYSEFVETGHLAEPFDSPQFACQFHGGPVAFGMLEVDDQRPVLQFQHHGLGKGTLADPAGPLKQGTGTIEYRPNSLFQQFVMRENIPIKFMIRHCRPIMIRW